MPPPQHIRKSLTYKGRAVFEKIITPFFDRVPKSYAENEACFIFVKEGAFHVRSQEPYFELPKGSGVLAKCMNYFFEGHEQFKASGGVAELIGVSLFPSLVEDIFDFDLSQSTHRFDFSLKRVQVDRLLEHFRESIDILIENPELADDDLIKTKVKEFVLLMSKIQGAPSQLDFLAAMFRPGEVDFRATVQNNLFANLSLDELASLCHLSPSSFKRKFREVYGESPKKYLTQKKLERAAELLRTDGLRISDIAYDVGFDSLATFNRNFAKTFGQSPTDYRLTRID